MRTSRMVRALLRALVVVAVVAVPAFAAETVINAVSGGRFVTLEGKRVPSVKVFFTNGVIQKSVLTESRASKVVVKADGGIKCGAEWPHIEVEVDDVQVMSAFVEGVNQTLEAPVSLPAGTHLVRVRFDNDYFEPSDAFTGTPPPPLTCDRNLLLDSVELVDDRWHDDASARRRPRRLRLRARRHRLLLRPANSADILWTGDAEKAMGRLPREPALAGQQRVGRLQLRRTGRASARSPARWPRVSAPTGSRSVTATTPTASAASWRTATRARAACTRTSCSTAARRCGSHSRPTCRRTSRSRRTARRFRSRATAAC